MRYACYRLSRAMYQKVVPSLKSLLRNSDVDKVFLLTEDGSDMGFDIPERVERISMENQKYFPKDGPNYECPWTHMSLVQAALPFIFPDIDLMLSIDADTVVIGDLNPIWDTKIGDHYLAAVEEPHNSRSGKLFVNCGVVLYNLRQLRKDGKAEEIIRRINTDINRFGEQDSIVRCCQGHIYLLNPMYNSSRFTTICRSPVIIHFPAELGWYYENPFVQQYKNMPWDECVRR